RECFKPVYGLPPDRETVQGVLSLIVWALILVVSVKYLTVIIRLDNRGEGGIMALLAMIPRVGGRRLIIGLALFGRGTALRRRDHHSRHLGPERHRGARDRGSGRGALRGAHRGARAAPALRVPASRDRTRGRCLRAGD